MGIFSRFVVEVYVGCITTGNTGCLSKTEAEENNIHAPHVEFAERTKEVTLYW
jgi:hypothetical protein